MLRFTLVLILAASSTANLKDDPKPTIDMAHLIGTYSLLGIHNFEGFFDVPRTVNEAEKKGWVIPDETANNTLFSTHCEKENPSVCILCDNMGSIAGYQVSFSTDIDIEGIKGINYTKQGYIKQTIFGNEVYSNLIWFVPQDVLENGGREFNNQTGEGLWLQIGDELLEVPLHESLLNTTLFVKQNCFARMGLHYFWNVGQNLTTEEFLPWFLLLDDAGYVSGFGLVAFGKQGDISKGTSWIEHVPPSAIKLFAPDVPQWIITDGGEKGIISHHAYFGDKPWAIKCK